MGLAIDRDHFDDADYERFEERLRASVSALAEVLARPGFGEGPTSIGAELEVSLVDAGGRPLPRNQLVLAGTNDPRFTLELDRFNLEINTSPRPIAGSPFAALQEELEGALAELGRAAAVQGGRVATVGILPTLGPADVGAAAMSESKRYRALSAGIRRLRGEPFQVHIEGEDTLAIAADDVTLEGANTSFQVHLRVDPAAFAATYNAAQIAAAPALAIAVNSPILLGHRLWDETRIALFRQSVDDRPDPEVHDWKAARVSFGHGWVRRGALELFAENVGLHVPLLPVLGPEDPVECVRAGGVPALHELRLHQGTVWSWNRAVYDPDGGGHVRIELRALPGGPTVIDMIANAAFLLGLTLGLAPDVEALLGAMTFGNARRNFYEAARRGLDAELLWPAKGPPSPRPVPARELVPRLVPIAREGLVRAGVDAGEVDRLLEVIEARASRGVTGARWQRRALAAMGERAPRSEAILAMFERYQEYSASGRPVHEWPIEG